MRPIDLRRSQSRGRLHTLLLLLGAALVTALSFQLWRTLQLESQARAIEVERAEIVAERILRAATGSRAVFEQVPASLRFVLRGDGVEVDDTVGWLHETASDEDADVVVQDRLERAARAEFAAKDGVAAEREFAEILARPLPSAQRMVVVAAAAWNHVRGVRPAACEALLQELDERIGKLPLEQLGRSATANAVAAALRLPRPGGSAVWVDRVVPFLPEAVHAGLPTTLQRRSAITAVMERRARLCAADAEWRQMATTSADGLRAVGGELLWWLPREDGGHDAARLRIDEWLAAVRAAGRAGALPEWPWLVDAEIAAAEGAAFAGVPHLRGLRPSAGPTLGQSPWLLPAITLVLLVAFGLAAWQQFRASRREADAVRAQAEFLTTVTHELKTPLASIRLLGEMLAEGRAQGREADYYRMLAGEAGRLSMLIENVLDLGRLERGERAYDLRLVDVREVVGETLSLFLPVAERDGLRIDRDDQLDSVVLVKIDRGAFVQALVCVLDNARKYAPAGARIDVVTRRDGERLQVAVRDRGPGVAESERERIFDRFVRGTAHAHGSTPGVGIGLYLARTIARRLGGDLVCVAPLDGGPGACFTFTLPMETTA